MHSSDDTRDQPADHRVPADTESPPLDEGSLARRWYAIGRYDVDTDARPAILDAGLTGGYTVFADDTRDGLVHIGNDRAFASTAEDPAELRELAREALPTLPGARLVDVATLTRASDQRVFEFDSDTPESR